MSKVFVGNITSESERVLNQYLNKFMPDAIIEPLKAAGIRGKIKNHARRPEVVLVILDETLFDMCKGVADDVLSLPKVHRYSSNSGLLEFLQEKFGVVEDSNVVKNDVVIESNEINIENNQQNVAEVIDDDENLIVSDKEDTSNDSDKDAIIQRLNDELIVKDTMLRNLEAQIEEKSASADVSHFVSRIKSLETELEVSKEELSKMKNDSYADLGKVARAEQIINSVDSLKDELSIEKENVIKLQEEKSELESKLKSKVDELQKLNLSVDDLNSKLEDYGELQSKIDELEDTISNLQSDCDLKQKEIDELIEKNKELEQKVIDLTSEVAEISLLNEKIENLSEDNKKLSDTNSELISLKVDLENLRVDYNKAISERDSLFNDVTNLKLELSSVNLNITTANSDKGKLESTIQDLSKQLNEVGSKLESKDKEIEDLREKLECSKGVSSELETSKSKIQDLQNEVSELTMQLKQFDDTKVSLSDKISEVESLQEEIKNKSLLEEELESLRKDLESKTNELNSIIDEINSQSSIVEEKDTELLNKNSEISNLNLEVERLSNEVTDLKTERESLEVDNKKLRNEVDVLRQKTTESDAKLQDSTNLTVELDEYKLKVARLQSENVALKEDLDKSKETTNKDLEIAKLRTEISDYKDKLRKVYDTTTEQAKSTSDEISQLRERCADLEISLVDKENRLKHTSESIFSKLGSIASPKTMFNLTLDVPKDLSNVFVFASGSSESNLLTYQVLRRFCSNTNKSVLILDLVNDSYIDREFGVDKLISPIEFLKGTKPINEFVSRAKVGNTYISSTACSYFNTLYLLNVDWKSVLTSVSSLTDIVIINIGCLNDVVSKVLFNAFASVMKSHIILKASPINLRTALLTLTGIQSATNSKVSCVNFENSSKNMYQKLAQKFNTQILKDSDVLKL